MPGIGRLSTDTSLVDQPNFTPSPARRSRKSQRLLLLFFLFSLPFLNPWVRGDGVGYYAFARAPLIEHSLDFTKDYQYANESFRGPRLDENNQPKSGFRTPTGHLDNHFTVGPAILWAPFLLLAHACVLLARALGSSVAANGFSAPYRLARQYVEERWALLATLAIWWASSLPLYMYFNPSWSHAHSAFVVALFFWYWHETRSSRSLWQWLLLAVITGLMLNVYYPNATVLTVLAVEAAPQYFSSFRRAARPGSEATLVLALLLRHFLFAAVSLICLLPTFLTRYVVYGSAFESGYIPLRDWLWRSPAFWAVLFSSNHGLLVWTPILVLAFAGLFLLWRQEPRSGAPLLVAFLAFYLFIACYPDWAGISSFGNRFFVSLTALFIIGLSVFLDRFAKFFRTRRAAFAAASAFLALFVFWNAGFMFQWGSHLIPARGPISFSEMIHNQFFVVPRQLSTDFRAYLFRRKALMQQIEQRDIQQLEKNPPQP